MHVIRHFTPKFENNQCAMTVRKCSVSKISSALEQELQVAILKKAILFEKAYSKDKKKFKRGKVN